MKHIDVSVLSCHLWPTYALRTTTKSAYLDVLTYYGQDMITTNCDHIGVCLLIVVEYIDQM